MKQESLKMNFDKIHSSILTIQEKQYHFINSYEQQLNNALINQDKQNDLYQRKLNKLTYERRQTDMRILSLTEEVKQKDLQNNELKTIKDQLLLSPIR
ncbi:unnamed protein product [Schistosoma mattheei]|uniref:Uncharacterized protein n=1 Tax=Schistosoma mattheei TaxID=31246 RepID=A0A183PYZ2_9TREM|nr:unnamed protein product [Schistosoma mattheei]